MYPTRKIVVIGPESTGKSTLSAALAAVLHTVWVPEYAREYLEPRANEYDYQDLLRIADGQTEQEDRLEKEASGCLVCDTDLYVIKVWSEHRYGKVEDRILQEIAARRYDLYLLCSPDIPWAADPLREYPEPEMRYYFYQIYRDIVIHSGVPWTTVCGSPEQRLEQALSAVRSL